MTSLSSKTALLLVDIQEGLDDLNFYGRERNNPSAEEKTKFLLDYWRTEGFPIIHIKHNSTNSHSPLAKGKKGNTIKELVQPHERETLIEKEVNSAFIETPLQKILHDLKVETLIFTGLTTDHCISSTVRMAANLGFHCYVVSDATACFNKTNSDGEKFSAELVHKISLACLENEFATIVKAEELITHLRS